MQNHARAESALKLFERVLSVGVDHKGRGSGQRLRRLGAAGGEALDLANGETGFDDPTGELNAFGGICNREKRAAVASGEAAVLDEIEDGLLEAKQTDEICDGGAVLTSALRDLFLGEAEFGAEAVEGAGLFDGVKMLALKIFDKGHLDGGFFGHVAKDHRDARKLGALCGAPASFAGNQLIAQADATDHERLDDAAGANRLREFLERFLTEPSARLIRARVDEVDIDVD